jgi:hypothetical protein
VKRAVVLTALKGSKHMGHVPLKKGDGIFVCVLRGTAVTSSVYPCIRFLLGCLSYNRYAGLDDEFRNLSVEGRRLLLRRDIVKRMKALKNSPIPKSLMADLVTEWETSNWIIWRIGECQGTADMLKELANSAGETLPEQNPGITAELFLSSRQASKPSSLLDRTWNQAIGVPVIPFAPASRERIAKNSKKLHHYFKQHLDAMKDTTDRT